MTCCWKPIGALTALVLGLGCSVIVEGEFPTNEDAGSTGETCSTDEQCISFDPFNCNRTCVAGFCEDGPVAPDATRCGTGAGMHCVAGTCVARECGDGYVDRTATPAEYCDDGNDNPDDACNNVCTRSCVPPAPANCSDGDVCNGEETCGMVAGVCRIGDAAADGTPCTAVPDGVCADGVCVAP